MKKTPKPIYIDSSYHRLNPSQPLPLPLLGRSTGLTCPACFSLGHQTTPLKYLTQLSTCWRVACSLKPPPGGGHYYRSWNFTQLNHEIASINEGNWPPKPYQPRQPAAANPIPIPDETNEPLAMFASQRLIEQIFRPTTSTSPAGSPKKSDAITCRGVDGRTSAHLPTEARQGNKRCRYRACASCCNTLGDKDRICPAKGHVSKHEGNSGATKNWRTVGGWESREWEWAV
ncbi:uncharacterized protein MELLADRAFT_95919 [Melampsora larici-populina 98AG31]|uniref:Uncharacterized protein n=1 Tax=Melampsora larici-populina (strain 98AG31 / pathotype 3-4-7) TaxID=747676 RepID=F4RDR2_MELLP|nr:uncharacterized protein MELLADRAFT_95919 [Melampsora larici-populina 98AG31]EGG09562.1 hypothetical protein MELLADRAFT_95919 [Melampsora larici-populina 98AG31]